MHLSSMIFSLLHTLFDDPTTQKIFETLKKNNIEARFVGGCVRDALLGKASHDIDLAVDALPTTIIQTFKGTKINIIPTGIDFGTVTAIIEGKPYQITSLRQDWQGKGRHPNVTFGKDWLEDAKRRDFTMNAIYVDSAGIFFDPFNGAQDLKKQYIRFVGNPEDRIKEDPLRILRYFRFLAMFDKPQIDSEAFDACKKLIQTITELSKERIREEFFKLLRASDPIYSLTLLNEIGFSEIFFGSSAQIKSITQLVELEKTLKIPPCPIRRLLQFLGSSFAVKDISAKLILSKKERLHLETLQRNSTLDNDEISLYKYGKEIFTDLILLSAAQQERISPDIIEKCQKQLITRDNYIQKTFPVTGEDLIKIGLEPSPKLGKTLEACKDWWMNQSFKPTHQDCLLWIDEYLGSEQPFA